LITLSLFSRRASAKCTVLPWSLSNWCSLPPSHPVLPPYSRYTCEQSKVCGSQKQSFHHQHRKDTQTDFECIDCVALTSDELMNACCDWKGDAVLVVIKSKAPDFVFAQNKHISPKSSWGISTSFSFSARLPQALFKERKCPSSINVHI
jgi:hypothetical protein